MSAKRLHIKDRYRQSVGVITSLADFVWSESGTIDAGQIINNPNISLYCLDNERQWAIFVVLPEHLILSHAPFVYQTQFDYAQYLIAVPYATFHQLANEISIDSTPLVWLHNIGRCGSTLLSQAFNEIVSVIALSEPDVFTNFIRLRYIPRKQQIALLQSSYKMIFCPTVASGASLYVVKLRSQCLARVDIFAEAFPQAKHLFMYRNAIDWVASWYRLHKKNGLVDLQFTYEQAIERQAVFCNRSPHEVAHFFDPPAKTYSWVMYLAIKWLMMVTLYLDTYQQTPRLTAIRYEDLMENRDAMLSVLFESVGLPKTALGQSIMAFVRDSQAGTKLARDDEQSGNTIQLPQDEIDKVHQILANYDSNITPDLILPWTLNLD